MKQKELYTIRDDISRILFCGQDRNEHEIIYNLVEALKDNPAKNEILCKIKDITQKGKKA